MSDCECDLTPVDQAHSVLSSVIDLTAEVEKLRGDIREAHAKLFVGESQAAELFLKEILDGWDYPKAAADQEARDE